MDNSKNSNDDFFKVALLLFGCIIILFASTVLIPAAVIGYMTYWMWFSKEERRYSRIIAGAATLACAL